MTDGKPAKKSQIVAAYREELRKLRMELRDLDERTMGVHVRDQKAVFQFAEAVRSHQELLAKLEDRLDVLAATALPLHENLLNEHETRLQGLEEMALGDRKKAPIKKASKGRRK